MKIDSAKLRVGEDEKIRLDKRPTRIDPIYDSKDEYRTILADHSKSLSAAQARLYADQRYAILLVFQATDAAGKDGVINHVMSGVNPQGFQVYSFKRPSDTELRHDFLWRTIRELPERGKIGIFNRSYYEEVLIVRVHPEILVGEGFSLEQHDRKSFWKDRYRSIVDLESHLHRNNTRILKFFLHISKEEQRRRFLSRIDEPDKNWKFNLEDVRERSFWDDYMEAYEKCIHATSTQIAPWHIIPADDKENARLIISQIIVDYLESLDLRYPEVDADRRRELLDIRRQLMEETEPKK